AQHAEAAAIDLEAVAVAPVRDPAGPGLEQLLPVGPAGGRLAGGEGEREGDERKAAHTGGIEQGACRGRASPSAAPPRGPDRVSGSGRVEQTRDAVIR